ncbi:MAG: MFS transporter [Dehalococcoidia bacterium]
MRIRPGRPERAISAASEPPTPAESPAAPAPVVASPVSAEGGPPSGRGPRLGALSDARYRRYWLGSLASIGGIQLVVLGQGWLIVQVLGGSPLALGALGGAQALPTILMTVFGGVIADRVDRRSLLQVTALVSASLLLLLGTLDVTGYVQIWHVILVAAGLGLVQGVDQPTRNAFFPALIDRQNLPSAVALNAILWQSTRIVSPMIGGIAIALVNTSVVFYMSAAGFIAMFFVLWSLRVPRVVQGPDRNVLRDLQEGVSFIARSRLFATLILLTYAHMFFGMQYIQLMPLVAARFGVGPEGLGLLFTVVGIGAVSGTLLTLRLQGGRALGRMLLVAVFTAELLIVAFAVAPLYEAALVLLFLASVANSVFTISSMTALQMRVPDHLRGRVMGLHGITFSMMPLGGLFGGAVAQVTDVRVSIALGGLIMIALIAFVTVTRREIARLDGRREAAAETS